jgi:hypothetical protein
MAKESTTSWCNSYHLHPAKGQASIKEPEVAFLVAHLNAAYNLARWLMRKTKPRHRWFGTHRVPCRRRLPCRAK